MPLETPSDGLDLTAMHEAGRAVEGAAARDRAEAIRARLLPALSALPDPVRAAMEAIIGEMGRIAAEAGAARQEAGESRRERGEWLQIDPLRHMPGDRGQPIPPAAASLDIRPGDPDFVGFGWHTAERRGEESWRWSGLAPAASIVLPDPGPGTVEVALHLELPFRHPFDLDRFTVLANGQPLALEADLAEPHRGVFTAQWEGSDTPGGTLALVLLGPLVSNPASPDQRKLGVGIQRVRARRLSADPS